MNLVLAIFNDNLVLSNHLLSLHNSEDTRSKSSFFPEQNIIYFQAIVSHTVCAEQLSIFSSSLMGISYTVNGHMSLGSKPSIQYRAVRSSFIFSSFLLKHAILQITFFLAQILDIFLTTEWCCCCTSDNFSPFSILCTSLHIQYTGCSPGFLPWLCDAVASNSTVQTPECPKASHLDVLYIIPSAQALHWPF